MEYFLSSSREVDPDNVSKLREMVSSTNKRVAYIPNASDYGAKTLKKRSTQAEDLIFLKKCGLLPDIIDLRCFFDKKLELVKKLEEYDIIWSRGGDIAVLRKAMELSGFDEIIKNYADKCKRVIYGGYSAGVCVLGNDFSFFNNKKSQENFRHTYGDQISMPSKGLGITSYTIVPHINSPKHPSSRAMESILEAMKIHNEPYKALKDGEVFIE